MSETTVYAGPVWTREPVKLPLSSERSLTLAVRARNAFLREHFGVEELDQGDRDLRPLGHGWVERIEPTADLRYGVAVVGAVVRW